ncbi:MAG: DUF2493 domain-containing protein [Chlorobi bacterium]|nr:DUF2493 domain-containing protein [Chlorobiota bacterium]
MKIIIAGNRNFKNYDLLQSKCNVYLKNLKHIEIISGMANGADKLALRYASENNFELYEFPALWHKYGKKAAYIRNREMAVYADALIAFWDGKSNGTKMMIDLARQYHLKIRIVYSQIL